MTAPNTTQLLLEAEASDRQVVRGRVVFVHDNGSVSVAPDSESRPLRCELLQMGDGPLLRLAIGDAVLLWRAGSEDAYGVILGRVGPSHASELEPSEEIPEVLVIEARSQITLRVGEGSITIREDGKILIKGKDLVSHAQRMNRIKGGAVAIN